MDKYYGNVCELDIIFSFQKAYFILDELLLAGEMQESSKKNVLRCISQQDSLEDMEVSQPFSLLRLSRPAQSLLAYKPSFTDSHLPCIGRGWDHEDYVDLYITVAGLGRLAYSNHISLPWHMNRLNLM